MRALVSNLACLMLAAHLMLGCCWHHAHACETACPHACQSGHLNGHSNEADHDHDQHAPPAEGDDHCQGERCSFLVVAKVRLDSGCGAASPVALLAETSSQVYADLAWLQLAADRTDSGPPLRLHLLHRVLRI
jgi:hypothetical protein